MSDNISRRAAIDALGDAHFENWGNAVMIVMGLPSTDRKGKWVGVREYCHHLTEVTGELYLPLGLGNHNICDQCWQSALEKSKYCPNCGADMRGVNK